MSGLTAEVRDREGYVYFIYCPELDRFKIGFSLEYPDRRFSNLSVASPAILEKHSLMRGTLGLEYRLHSKFRPSRFKGEWFRSTPELLRYIEENATRWDELLEAEIEATWDDEARKMEAGYVGLNLPLVDPPLARRGKSAKASQPLVKKKRGRPPKPVVIKPPVDPYADRLSSIVPLLKQIAEERAAKKAAKKAFMLDAARKETAP